MQQFNRPVHVAGGVHGPSFRSLSTTHPRLVTKVDNRLGLEVAARQGLAEMATHEENRCILVVAPVSVLAGDRARSRDLAGTISGTIVGTIGFV